MATNYVYLGGQLLYADIDGALALHHYDFRGSTLAITNGAGVVTDRFTYSPYGELMRRTGTTATPFQFHGAWDIQTDANGLLQMRARYYSTELRRFVNADPIGFDGGSNWYAFVGGDPIGGIDPHGLFVQHLDLYESQNQLAAQGWERGGFIGNLQGNFYSATSALLDVVGGGNVSTLSGLSGEASGRGETMLAVSYGVATGGVIFLESFSFGRFGQMAGGTRYAGLEFSHSIPNRVGGPRAWWNGSMVNSQTHAMMDPYRMLAGMKLGDKWPFPRQMLNRAPAWLQGVFGTGSAKAIEAGVDK